MIRHNPPLPKCYPIPINPDILAHYQRELGLKNLPAALLALAQAILNDSFWVEIPNVVFVARTVHQPVLAIVGSINPEMESVLAARVHGLYHACADLRYVDYDQAEQDCERLASQLIKQYGRDDLRHFHFAAIPRGGIIVLGILSYVLGLTHERLLSPHPPHIPLVVIDDCAFTGARFSSFLESCPGSEIIFAHLYSHPFLRAAIMKEEPRVIACLSAHDLTDHGPRRIGGTYPQKQEHWRESLGNRRYWVGQTDHICFPWKEPDRTIWNAETEQIETAWHILPPEFCLSNRSIDLAYPSLQVQPKGPGPLRPSSDVIFGQFQEQIVIGNLKTKASFGLSDAAAAMWQAILRFGNLEQAAAELATTYKVSQAVLQKDLHAFTEKLLARGLLEQDDGATDN